MLVVAAVQAFVPYRWVVASAFRTLRSEAVDDDEEEKEEEEFYVVSSRFTSQHSMVPRICESTGGTLSP